MSEVRYAISVDELVASARVPLAEQVATQVEPQPPARTGPPGVLLYADGMSGDADGD